MQSEIEALGSSTRSFQESDLKLSNKSTFEQKTKTDSSKIEREASKTFEQNVEKSHKTDANVVKGTTERRMSNFMITSSVEIEENSNQSFYASDSFRNSTTPDDLPK